MRWSSAEARLGLPDELPALLAIPGELLTPVNAGSDKRAIATLRRQHADGADFIKAGMISPDVLCVLQDEAARVGIDVLGHLPAGVDVREASHRGFRSIEHLGPGVGVLASCCYVEHEVRRQMAGRPAVKSPPLVAFPPAAELMERLMASRIERTVVNPQAEAADEDVAILALADRTFETSAPVRWRRPSYRTAPGIARRWFAYARSSFRTIPTTRPTRTCATSTPAYCRCGSW